MKCPCPGERFRHRGFSMEIMLHDCFTPLRLEAHLASLALSVASEMGKKMGSPGRSLKECSKISIL
jgi:hypothetical protein